MKITLNLTWGIFWVALASVIIAMVMFSKPDNSPKEPTAAEVCAKNNGVPIYSEWSGRMTDCKIYQK